MSDEGHPANCQSSAASNGRQGAEQFWVTQDVEYGHGFANWKGPIGDFTPTLEKESPDQLVSLIFRQPSARAAEAGIRLGTILPRIDWSRLLLHHSRGDWRSRHKLLVSRPHRPYSGAVPYMTEPSMWSKAAFIFL